MANTLDLGNLLVHIKGDTSQLLRSMHLAENAVAAVGKRMVAVGRSLSIKVTAPLVAYGATAVKAFSNFDDAMTKSLAIMGDVSPQMRHEMEKTAELISGKSITGATELAKSYFFLASAGMNAAQSIAALPAVEQFAVAGAFDMATATDLATDAQSALGLKSADTQKNLAGLVKVTDVLVRANTVANANVEQFAKALTTDAGTALKSYKIEMEQGVAVLAAYADQGIKGEKAGSMFARMLRLTTQGFNDNRAAWDKMNVNIFDAKGEYKELGTIVRDLTDSMAQMSTEQKINALEMLGFTARSQQAILPILGLGDAIDEYTEKFRKAAGFTKEVSDKQLKSFASQIKMTWNQIKGISKEIGRMLAPGVLRLNAAIKKAIKVWHDLDDTVKANIVKILSYAAAVGPTLIVMGTLLKLVSGLLSPIGFLSAAFLGLAIDWKSFIGAVREFRFEDIETMTNLFIDKVLYWKDVLIEFAKWLKVNWRDGLKSAFISMIPLMEALGATMIDLAIRTGKGIYAGFKAAIGGPDNKAILEQYKKLLAAGPIKPLDLTKTIQVPKDRNAKSRVSQFNLVRKTLTSVAGISPVTQMADVLGDMKNIKVDPEIWGQASKIISTETSRAIQAGIWDGFVTDSQGRVQEAIKASKFGISQIIDKDITAVARLKMEAREMGRVGQKAFADMRKEAQFLKDDLKGLEQTFVGKAMGTFMGPLRGKNNIPGMPSAKDVDGFFTMLSEKISDIRVKGGELFQSWVDFNHDAFESMKGAASTALDGIADNLTSLVLRGKADFNMLANSIVNDLVRIIIKAQMAKVLMGVFGMTAGGVVPGVGMFGSNAQGIPTGHTGGIVGQGALRMHSGGTVGLKRDEVPIIAQTGERLQSRAEVNDESFAGSIPPGANINIYAMDSNDVGRVFMQNKQALASSYDSARQNNHPARRRRR